MAVTRPCYGSCGSARRSTGADRRPSDRPADSAGSGRSAGSHGRGSPARARRPADTACRIPPLEHEPALAVVRAGCFPRAPPRRVARGRGDQPHQGRRDERQREDAENDLSGRLTLAKRPLRACPRWRRFLRHSRIRWFRHARQERWPLGATRTFSGVSGCCACAHTVAVFQLVTGRGGRPRRRSRHSRARSATRVRSSLPL